MVDAGGSAKRAAVFDINCTTRVPTITVINIFGGYQRDKLCRVAVFVSFRSSLRHARAYACLQDLDHLRMGHVLDCGRNAIGLAPALYGGSITGKRVITVAGPPSPVCSKR